VYISIRIASPFQSSNLKVLSLQLFLLVWFQFYFSYCGSRTEVDGSWWLLVLIFVTVLYGLFILLSSSFSYIIGFWCSFIRGYPLLFYMLVLHWGYLLTFGRLRSIQMMYIRCIILISFTCLFLSIFLFLHTYLSLPLRCLPCLHSNIWCVTTTPTLCWSFFTFFSLSFPLCQAFAVSSTSQFMCRLSRLIVLSFFTLTCLIRFVFSAHIPTTREQP